MSLCLCGGVVLLLFPLIRAMGLTNYNTGHFSILEQHSNELSRDWPYTVIAHLCERVKECVSVFVCMTVYTEHPLCLSAAALHFVFLCFKYYAFFMVRWKMKNVFFKFPNRHFTM